MPTIDGGKSGTRPYLQLDWSVNSQDVANNRSSVNLKLYLKVDYSIGYSARYTGTLQGASFTSSSGYISKPGRYLLTQRDVWIGHNSDGTKTASFTADYNLNITWSGTYYGKISLSGTGSLGTIPRASTMSAFSFGSHLKNGVANTISYTVDRKSGNFRHHIQLRDGNTVVFTWDNQNTNGTNTIDLTAANVNTLLSRMSTVTSKTFTLRIATRSSASGGFIGSAVSRTAKATVHADVKPTVSALTVSQTGNSVTTAYLQSKSKVKASFTRTAVGGATIVSSSITVRRKTSNNDVQTINSNDGTTGRAVRLSGTYQAQGTVRDSRGRTNVTAWAEFSVTAYSAPTITNFSAARNGTTATTVNISRATTHTVLGTSNHLTYSIQRKQGTGAWANVNTGATGSITTSGATGSATSTGNAVTTSYDFRMVVTDKFGESAESVISVSTQRVVLDIHKNEGVGIGKIHEQGVLDVDGQIVTNGRLDIIPNVDGSNKSDPIRIFSKDPNGHGYIEYWGSNNDRKAIVGFPTNTHNGFEIRNVQGKLLLSGTSVEFNSTELISRGSNSNGEWVRLYDGTQICWNYSHSIAVSSSYGNTNWTYPTGFSSSVIPVTVGVTHTTSPSYNYTISTNRGETSHNHAVIRAKHINNTSATNEVLARVIAIGRWK